MRPSSKSGYEELTEQTVTLNHAGESQTTKLEPFMRNFTRVHLAALGLIGLFVAFGLVPGLAGP
jgi:hypothetical protein